MRRMLLISLLIFLVAIGTIFGQGAKDEGVKVVPFGESVEDQVVVGTSTGPDGDWAEAVVPEFQAYIKEKYGKDIDVILDRGAMTLRWTKFITEWPKPSADVTVVTPNFFFEGIDKGYWVKVDDYLSSEERDGLDQAEYVRSKGYGVPYERQFYGPVVRTDLIPFEFESWNDLTDPRLTNRTTMDSALKVGSGYLAVLGAAISSGDNWEDWRNADGTLNEDAATPTLKVLRKWYENALTLTEGSGTIRPLLNRGEVLVSLWWSSQAIVERGKGENVAFVFPKEGTISQGGTNWAVASKASSPNLGIEWVKFITSKKGYEIAYNKANLIGYLVPRSDVIPPREEQAYIPSPDVVIHSGNDFRSFIESELVQSDFIDLYTRIVVEGRK